MSCSIFVNWYNTRIFSELRIGERILMIKIYKWHPILALVVALSTIISPEVFYPQKIISALAETTLQDIENHFAQPCINSLLEKTIIFGDYESQTFRPNAPVTRAEFAVIINRAFPDTKIVRDSMKFVDIPQDYWAYDAIQKSYKMGFLSGYIGKTFNPTLKITRWQVLAALRFTSNVSWLLMLTIDGIFLVERNCMCKT